MDAATLASTDAALEPSASAVDDSRRRTSVASVYLPCVPLLAVDPASSVLSSVSSVHCLLAGVDFTAVTEHGTELSLSATAPSAAATALFLHFRQQAHIAGQWRKQQTAHWAEQQQGADRQKSSNSGGSKRHDDVSIGSGEEEKQQLSVASHGAADSEQLVRPVTSRSTGHRQLDRSSSRDARRKAR